MQSREKCKINNDSYSMYDTIIWKTYDIHTRVCRYIHRYIYIKTLKNMCVVLCRIEDYIKDTSICRTSLYPQQIFSFRMKKIKREGRSKKGRKEGKKNLK